MSRQTSRVVAATIGEEAEDPLIDFRISFADRQVLKTIEDKILDLFIIFDSMTDTLRELCYQWSNGTSCSRSGVLASLRDNIAEMALHRHKAKTLLERLRGTTALVRLGHQVNPRQMLIGSYPTFSILRLAVPCGL